MFLRVKNKIDSDGNLEHFNDIDITILNNIASIISYQYELEANYIKDKKEKDKELLKKTEENYNLISSSNNDITKSITI